VRDVVRQQVVAHQLRDHLPGPGERALRVLDAGCGQGTQALQLARLGHTVLGVDVSERLLQVARDAAARETRDVRRRLTFEHADLLCLGPRSAGRFDLICCHGVLMYLPSLHEALTALVAAARPNGLISILTRNQAALAMRAGMSRDWSGALESFDAHTYTNRLGIEDVRAHDPAEVRRALVDHGADTIAWYGVRLFCDHWPRSDPPPDVDALIAAEREAGRRDPYRALAALTHTVARVTTHARASHT
jgi:SAM-dependent methyltransferase